MSKSKTIKFKKRKPATKKPFNFAAYDDAKTLVKAYFEYKHGRSYDKALGTVIAGGKQDPKLNELIMTAAELTDEEWQDFYKISKKYRKWCDNALLVEEAFTAMGILSENAPDEWHISFSMLEYLRFSQIATFEEIEGRASYDDDFHHFMLIAYYNTDIEDNHEAIEMRVNEIATVARFFDFSESGVPKFICDDLDLDARRVC